MTGAARARSARRWEGSNPVRLRSPARGLSQWRGRVLSREHLLTSVRGSRYSGGRRTVDIHVRRLRAKLGNALPLETVRDSGYRLRGAGESSDSGDANSGGDLSGSPLSGSPVLDDQPISAAVFAPTLSSAS